MRCEECHVEADAEARGWRAYVVEDDDCAPLVLVFCARCADREFGSVLRRRERE